MLLFPSITKVLFLFWQAINSNGNPIFLAINPPVKFPQFPQGTENVIGFYTYLDDPNFDCWYYWSMDYTNLGISPITGLEMIEFIDEEDGPIQLSVNILDNGNLQLGDDQGEGVQL